MAPVVEDEEVNPKAYPLAKPDMAVTIVRAKKHQKSYENKNRFAFMFCIKFHSKFRFDFEKLG